MNIDEKLEESIENKYMKEDKDKNKMELTIEESVYILKRRDFNAYIEEKAIETLLTAYEKEKEEHKKECHNCDEYTARLGELETENKMLKAEIEKEKRLAEANLKDSEEFQDNMCNHRCILNLKVEELKQELEKEKEKNKTLKQENSFLKMMYRETDEFKAIENLAKEE